MNRLLLGKTGSGVKREAAGGDAVRSEIEASNSGPVKKKTLGRRKIEIKRIEKESHRQVTFSKRRRGLFKKASEVCLLCGAQVAIVLQSPGKKIFSYGHPSTDAVLDRFLSGVPPAALAEEKKKEAEEHNLHYSKVHEKVQMEKKVKKETEDKKKSGDYTGEDFWWNQPVDGLGLEELKVYLEALQELTGKLAIKLNDRNNLKSMAMLPPPPPPPPGADTLGTQDVGGGSGSGLLNDVSSLLSLNSLNFGSDHYNNLAAPQPQGQGDTVKHGKI